MIPGTDLLLALARRLEDTHRQRLQHRNPAYLAHEAARLAAYQDSEDTRLQLAKYGVEIGSISAQ